MRKKYDGEGIMSIEIKNLTKKYGNYTAISDINFTVEGGELFALLGPSGCGKTTLLRTIAGLEVPDEGSINLNGKETSTLSPGERGVGFVFQHFALFKHMTIFDNVAFGLKVRPRKLKPSKAEIRMRVLKLLGLVQMEWSEKHYPSQLSGGQRQRIALARALAVEPSVLLLDEPFSALDAKVRQELRKWIKKLHEEIHVTTIFVTHDQEEALELADKIVIINKGKVEQIGTPEEVYENPANPFVYNFLGSVNVFHSRLDSGIIRANEKKINDESLDIGYVRPHDVKISRERIKPDDIEVLIRDIRLMKSSIGLELECVTIEGVIEAEIQREQYYGLNLKKGESVFIKLQNVKFFSKDLYAI
jgi:sulfate transport system ATP-binding protein